MERVGWSSVIVRTVRRLQWLRGLRAGVAVAGAMLGCRAVGWPMGWAALGGFEAILVDNGGPYRSRLGTMATLTVGGSVACVVGALAGKGLLVAIVVTAVFCFAATFARVASEWIASTSVIVLVLYFAGYGGETHTFSHAAASAGEFALGCAWAATLSLVLWPFDPFRPARKEVAACYRLLAEFTGGMGGHSEVSAHSAHPVNDRTSQFQRTMRLQIEAARRALGGTPARVTARTVRARNLTVLLETADMLFAIALRWREMAEAARDAADRNGLVRLGAATAWLGAAERAVHAGLIERPPDGAASYLPEGSHSLEHVWPHVLALQAESARADEVGTLSGQLWADEREALEDIQIAFEAVRAIWSGTDVRAFKMLSAPDAAPRELRWLDAARANWTTRSVMMRHALRMGVVAGADVLLMRWFHVQHGYWMAMTSIIVLQPYRSGTVRKGAERVGGTIGGGILAAVLAVTIHGRLGLIAAVTITSTLTLATYAVDYGWYSFFLTPTFVLLSLPYARDWRFAGVRMGTTVVGAMVALLAMRLLWPEREHVELGRLLALGAKADAAALRAMLSTWRGETDAQAFAAARRFGGLAINDAEEALDRMLREPGLGLGRRPGAGDLHAEALTFVTYLRRLLRLATMLSAVGTRDRTLAARVEAVADRLEALAATLTDDRPALHTKPLHTDAVSSAEPLDLQQMRRMERQIGVLERTAAALNRDALAAV